MNSANEKKLVEIFTVILELENDNKNVLSISRLTEENWDSLAHVSIVAAIESEFGVTLESDQMERMSSFAATRLILEEKGL